MLLLNTYHVLHSATNMKGSTAGRLRLPLLLYRWPLLADYATGHKDVSMQIEVAAWLTILLALLLLLLLLLLVQAAPKHEHTRTAAIEAKPD
jgi:hypothetical protein